MFRSPNVLWIRVLVVPTSSFTISQAEFKTGYHITVILLLYIINVCIYQGENYWKITKTLNKEWQYWCMIWFENFDSFSILQEYLCTLTIENCTKEEIQKVKKCTIRHHLVNACNMAWLHHAGQHSAHVAYDYRRCEVCIYH